VQFAGLVRRIWPRRNDVIHGRIFSHPNTILQNTIRAVQEYTLAQTRGEQRAYQRGCICTSLKSSGTGVV
jgi:hypothetical protein